MQVLQIWMEIPVLGFLWIGSIVILQFLIHLLRRFWACKNCELRSQFCLIFFRLWCLSCNIWNICSVTMLWQCTIHIIHEKHMLLYFQHCHGPWFFFLVVQMVCNLSLICQRVVHERIYLDWLWIFASYLEWLLLDIKVYPKSEMRKLDWHCIILQ